MTEFKERFQVQIPMKSSESYLNETLAIKVAGHIISDHIK